MTRIKKAAVRSSLKRDWLKRHEENGESVPEIARKDGYDVRTVRKQIELARQERESRETRSLVLRQAMEKHYEDLLDYVEYLDASIVGSTGVSQLRDAEYFEAALREHLPRSPIWDYRSRIQDLDQKEKIQMARIKAVLEESVAADPRLSSVTVEQDVLVAGITAALSFQAAQWSHGNAGINIKDNLQTEPDGEKFVNLRYGSFFLGKVDGQRLENVKKLLAEIIPDIESRLRENEKHLELEKTARELDGLKRKLHDELTVIRLKRIVPGHCKLCPL